MQSEGGNIQFCKLKALLFYFFDFQENRVGSPENQKIKKFWPEDLKRDVFLENYNVGLLFSITLVSIKCI